MSTNPEVPRLNLEFLRKSAKSLLKQAHSGDPAALERIARHTRKSAPPFALHDAQLAVAREQGFPSWPRLHAFIEESALDAEGLTAKFIDAALSDLRPAQDLLARHPELAAANRITALVLGDLARVEPEFTADPNRVTAKIGPRSWQPLLYVCFSRFANPASGRADSLVETARVLLAHGADPNATQTDPRWPDSPLSCLYAAVGVNNNPELARLLLDHGARADDRESLYHSTEHHDLACFRLLLEHGASPRATNALKHMLDWENLEGVRLLLAAGADPNEPKARGETALHWAVFRARSPEVITALLDAGADPNARTEAGHTAYQLAFRSGQTGIAELLASRGADTTLNAVDRLLGTCAAADPTDLPRILETSGLLPLSSEYYRLLPEFASSHLTPAVRALLAAGVPVDSTGNFGGSALHWACWKGYADLVELLIAHGASLTLQDADFHATPSQWLFHGIRASDEPGVDYPQVARLLLAAGAPFAPDELPTGNPALDQALREHGLI